MRTAFLGIVCAAIASLAAPPSEGQLSTEALRVTAAMQSGYYDELDLSLYASLDAKFGGTSRVLPSANVVTFRDLEVRAKLIVPHSATPPSAGFWGSKSPEPVRVMLDYALVSCMNGCTVSILTNGRNSPVVYRARHQAPAKPRFSPSGGGTTVRHRGPRTASMVLIEGKRAREAIRQINESTTVHIFLTTAVHGAAHFEFDTSSSVKN